MQFVCVGTSKHLLGSLGFSNVYNEYENNFSFLTNSHIWIVNGHCFECICPGTKTFMPRSHREIFQRMIYSSQTLHSAETMFANFSALLNSLAYPGLCWCQRTWQKKIFTSSCFPERKKCPFTLCPRSVTSSLHPKEWIEGARGSTNVGAHLHTSRFGVSWLASPK